MMPTAIFPPIYESIRLTTLLDAYNAGPSRVRESLVGLTATDFQNRIRGPETWSISDIIIHLSESELVAAARVRMVLSEPGKELPFYDQDRWANNPVNRTASASDLETSLDMFTQLRLTTGRYFRLASDGDWGKTGIHYQFGTVSLRNLLELYADHTERHIDQILTIRRMIGKPLEMSLLLETRLY